MINLNCLNSHQLNSSSTDFSICLFICGGRGWVAPKVKNPLPMECRPRPFLDDTASPSQSLSRLQPCIPWLASAPPHGRIAMPQLRCAGARSEFTARLALLRDGIFLATIIYLPHNCLLHAILDPCLQQSPNVSKCASLSKSDLQKVPCLDYTLRKLLCVIQTPSQTSI